MKPDGSPGLVETTTAGSNSRRVLWVVTLNFFLSHLGMFALLPILALHVRDSGASAASVGFTLALYTFIVRAAGLFTAGPISAVSDRAGAWLAMLLTSAGLAVLAAVPDAPLIPCLVLIALGINTNGLFIRSLLNRHTESTNRASAYGVVAIAINIAAAIGPFVGTLVHASAGARMVFGISSVLYFAAAAVTLASPREPSTAAHARIGLLASWSELIRLVRVPGALRLVGVTVVGWLAYAQLFSALPLFLSEQVGRGGATAAVFAANAVTVAAVQRPVTATTTALARRGWTHLHSQTVGLGLFAISFPLLCIPHAGLPGVIVAVVVFSVAEAVTTPAVDASFADLPSQQRLAPVNLRSSVNALGETAGVFCGGTVYLILSSSVSPDAYWAAIALLVTAAAVFAGFSLRAERRQVAPRRALAAEPE